MEELLTELDLVGAQVKLTHPVRIAVSAQGVAQAMVPGNNRCEAGKWH